MRDKSARMDPFWIVASLLLFLNVGPVACGGEPPSSINAGGGSFSGRFDLLAVDGAEVPAPVQVSFLGGATMQVESGLLSFETGNEVRVGATGPLGQVGDLVTLGTGGVYVRVASDSLRTTTGISGRIWGDTAEVRTTSLTLLGAHTWRYVRMQAPP